MFEWDEAKDAECRRLRGFGFDLVEQFDFASARILVDDRKAYGEMRYRAFNRIDGVIYNVVFTPRAGKLRIISMRRVHEKEGRRYGL